MRREIVLGLLIFLNSLALGFQKEVKADMKKEGKILVITLSAEERAKLFKEYEVKEGDTLTKLSDKFEVKINEIVEDNEIKNPDLIIVKQKLKIEDKENSQKSEE